MGRVSSAPEDAFHFKGTFQDGWGEIVAAQALVFQFPPAKETKGNRKAGEQDPPALYCELMIERHTDGDGNRIGTPAEQVLLKICNPDKGTMRLESCHPGSYPDGNLDLDPEDCGNDLGAAGNTLFAMQDGFQINDKTKWMSFTGSLVEAGFKPAVLKRTYFPDLVGLRAYFQTVQMPKGVNDDFDSTKFIVQKGSVRQYPYEKAAAPTKSSVAGAGAAKAKGATAPKANGPSPAAIASSAAIGSSSGEASGLTAEQIATAIITDTLAPAKKGVVLSDIKKLRVEVLMCMSRHKPAIPQSLKKEVQETMNVEWLEAIGMATDTFSVQEDGTVAFA
jgi:hypothetical protein